MNSVAAASSTAGLERATRGSISASSPGRLPCPCCLNWSHVASTLVSVESSFVQRPGRNCVTLRLNPHLSFRDDAREAMTFYQSVLGGELTISTFGEFQAAEDAAERDKVMHAQLETP